MEFDNLTDRDINVLGSYWGILKHADCRTLWKRYANMKMYKDLDINVHERDFVRNVLYIPIIVHNSWIFQKKGVYWLGLECSYQLKENGNDVDYSHVFISTSGEKLVEAGKQFKPTDYDFQTTIVRDNNGFYEFT